MNNFAILCPGSFDYILNKTGNMLIRYRPEFVSCIIDPEKVGLKAQDVLSYGCLLYTSPSPRDGLLSRMPSSA